MANPEYELHKKNKGVLHTPNQKIPLLFLSFLGQFTIQFYIIFEKGVDNFEIEHKTR